MTETNDQVIRKSQLEMLKRKSLAEAKYSTSAGQGHQKGSDSQAQRHEQFQPSSRLTQIGQGGARVNSNVTTES